MSRIVLFSMALPSSLGLAFFYANTYGYFIQFTLVFLLGLLFGMCSAALIEIAVDFRNYRRKS